MQDKIWKGFVLAFACCVAVGYVWLYLATNAPAEAAAEGSGSAVTLESETEDTAQTTDETESADDTEEESDAEVSITMPAEFVNGRTEAELEEETGDAGCSVTLNGDGTATYEMTEEQRAQLLSVISEEFEHELIGLTGTSDYPSMSSIATNGDFSSFTIRTTATAPETYETALNETLCQYSEWYALFSGEDAGTVLIEYINEDTGAVISSFSSADAETEETTTVTETSARTA